jgi:hypothetical protein
MTIELYQLIFGIALLWFPRHWMRRGAALLQRRPHSKGSQRVTEPWKDREPGDPAVSLPVEFKKFRNYVDLVRGLAGGLAIWGGMGIVAAVGVAAGAKGNSAKLALGVQCAIVLLGVVIQAVRYEKNRVSFFPPIFFLTGLSVGMCGYKAASFAFVTIWVVNFGLKNALSFLLAYAVVLYAFGALFGAPTRVPVMLCAFLAFLPALLSLLADRPLMIFMRKSRHMA